ncbi:MAG: hypothetical protein JST89_00740 [Cyanobacteria bacterium SZAS-4]|nr:hypothetical protein [Cyanobacteria bacterium SZAS-4]
MKIKKYTSILVLSTVLVLAMSQMSQAATVTFEGTPVKQASLDGKWNKDPLKNDNSDQATGIIYFSESTPEQFAVAVLTNGVTPETKQIFQKVEGKLSGKQKSELQGHPNPATLRACAERGEPEMVQISGKNLLLNNFVQEERINIATANGAQCKQAFKYECHAFALVNEKLVHIFLVQAIMNAPENASLLPSMTKQFHGILSTLEWH